MFRVARFDCFTKRSAAWYCVLSISLLASLMAAADGSFNNLEQTPLAPRSGPRGSTLFKILPPTDTGVLTENRYADPVLSTGGNSDPRVRADRYHEFSVGAVGTGIAIGDYDGDGRPDIFVVSKTESCRLFRNLGNWKFEDVTDKARVGDVGEAATVWKQGATFVDVNNDGLLDIYVCRFNAPNLLYINQGDGTFKEMAHAYGLDVSDASVMAAFCDYDRDGWLDVFIQTNLLDAVAHPNGQRNYLFHNNHDGTFSNVTAHSGIDGEKQGHSAIWWDFDGDGWPDLYVANDFAAPDSLYHNNHDGTFTDVINQVVPHMPYSSMGSDLGDVNNDGLVDLFVADMAATTHEKDQRTMANARSLAQDPPDNSLDAPQYPRNALYLNTGTGRCLEAAYLAGLAATDWTWAARLEDLDNDGRLDLFVTNGMHHEVHNADLVQRIANAETPAERERLERSSPILNERHLAFRNLGNLTFEDQSAAWGLDQKGVAFGAAFGDLDGDGDLDLVYSNYRGGVTLLRNDSDSGHRLIVALRGIRSNRFGIGSVVRIETDSGIQIRPLVLARGVLSSSEPVVHFGLGDDTRVNRLQVTWPSGEIQSFTNLEADRRITITEPAVPIPAPIKAPPTREASFNEVSHELNISYSSRESPINELGQNPLLPVRQNRRGPGLAVGDLLGNGNDDIVIGGTPQNPLRVVVSDKADHYSVADVTGLVPRDSLDDGPVLLFDANGDDRVDLLVTSGGCALPAGSVDYQPRLFLNNGHGDFRPAPDDALPSLRMSVGAVAAADFNRDGHLDLFIGGRVVPGLYPLAPQSALLANRGGKFEDVTDSLAPGLRNVGMVTAALWSDVDGDGWPDLLLALEWGQIKYFHNNRGIGFEDRTEQAGFATAGSGWWTSIAAADFNGDGRLDYVVGNVGLNTQYHASSDHPALLYFGDFNNGSAPQLIEAYFEGDHLFPWRSRKDLGARIPAILKRFPRNDSYARATLADILGEEKLAAASRFSATELRSGVFLSGSDGSYHFEPLPKIMQIAPLQGMVAGDFNGDGNADIYAVQNSYAPAPVVGRFDGGLGQLLLGDGHGNFTPVPLSSSQLAVPGDAKALVTLDLNHDGWPDFVVSRNNDSTLAFRNAGVSGRHSLCIKLRGPSGNLTGIGGRITVVFSDGSRRVSEIYAGSGYFSQSTAACFFGWVESNPPKEIVVRWPSGQEANYPVSPSSKVLILPAPEQK
jgi:enediyne biosynthesis protein E4